MYLLAVSDRSGTPDNDGAAVRDVRTIHSHSDSLPTVVGRYEAAVVDSGV